ncbi:MAG: SDR family oxidoreductase [Myxococcota bacterium]
MSDEEVETPPPQKQQRQPGLEQVMEPRPIVIHPDYKGSGKLRDKVALITGGDSGIGRAVAVHFAREGADVSIVYLNEHVDAEETRSMVEAEGRRCLLTAGDLREESFCTHCVDKTVEEMGHLEIVVNNAAEQHLKDSLEEISAEQLESTFRTNILAFFHVTRAALPHLQSGDSIINCTSVVAYLGHARLMDYAATKGAIVAFTRSLAQNLSPKGIRVNGVAPGPIWTPLVPATFPPQKTARHGGNVALGRVGQPADVAPSFVFLASSDSRYFTGQVLHPNGGSPVNG